MFGPGTHVVIDVQGYHGPSAGLSYRSLAPCRLADTRLAGGAFAAAERRTFVVSDLSGVTIGSQGGNPSGCGVGPSPSSVEISITAVGPTGDGFGRAWPGRQALPNATFINYTSGVSVTNTGTVAVNPSLPDEQLNVQAFGAGTHLVIDVAGYHSAASPGRLYTPITPCRVADTRQPGAGGALIGANRERGFTVAGSGPDFAAQGGNVDGCGLPEGVKAVEASVTAVTPTAKGYARAWPTDTPYPEATFINYSAGVSITNTGTIPLATPASNTDINVRANGGGIHVVMDIQGYFSAPEIDDISAGREFTCAVLSTDRVACWGDNFYGQLGNGTTTTSSSVPVRVVL